MKRRGRKHEIRGSPFSDGRPLNTSCNMYPKCKLQQCELATRWNQKRFLCTMVGAGMSTHFLHPDHGRSEVRVWRVVSNTVMH